MKKNERWWDPIYQQVAPILAVLTLLAALFATVGVFWNDRVNGQQDRQRIADNAALLDCFDTFATSLAGGLPPVREATVARDVALAAALLKLQDGLVKVGSDTFTARDLAQIIHLFDVYRTATTNLEKVRGENPYPEAPSKFCNDAAVD